MHVCVCVFVCVFMCTTVYEKSETICKNWFFPSTMLVPRTELRKSGLAKSTESAEPFCWLCVCVCVCVYKWRPEVDIWCLPQLFSNLFVFCILLLLAFKKQLLMTFIVCGKVCHTDSVKWTHTWYLNPLSPSPSTLTFPTWPHWTWSLPIQLDRLTTKPQKSSSLHP